jgi:hypothetical protein
MFEKTLQDLVKGIRANKRDPGAFISQAIAEIKVELKNVDPFIKVGAYNHRKSSRAICCMSCRSDCSFAAVSLRDAHKNKFFFGKRRLRRYAS